MAKGPMMLKEIFEQPEIVRNQIEHLMERPEHIEKAIGSLTDGKKEIYAIGCGTSFNAALVAKHLLEEHCGIKVHARISSEFQLTREQAGRGGTVMALSQSGGTADTLRAVRHAKEYGFRIIAIVNGTDSEMEKLSDLTIHVNAGPEHAIASTKTYSAQVATVVCLVCLICGTGHHIDGNIGDAIGRSLQSIIDKDEEIKRIAKIHANSSGFIFLGKGIDHITCREACLKMSEVNYIIGTAIPAGEFRHGPIAMADGRYSVVGIVSDIEHRSTVEYNLRLAKESGARTLLVTSHAGPETNECCDDVIPIPTIDPMFMPILSIVPLQLLAYHIGEELGNDIDSPRNLVKCVGGEKTGDDAQ